MISVIIPVYNVEKYLRECLDSVVNQSFQDKEIILVDDGSTDSSYLICEEYASRFPFIRIVQKANGGLSSARNRGIEESSGEWLIFLDSDDLWNDKDCLAKLYNYACALDLDIVRFEYQAVNENLELIEHRNYNKSLIENRTIDNFELVKTGIAGEWFAVLYLIKRNVIGSLRFNEQTKFQEDIDFYCRLFGGEQFRCGYLDEKMYLYRKRTASITRTFKKGNLEGSFRLCDVFYQSSKKTKDPRLSNLFLYYSVMMYYWTLQTMAAYPYYPEANSLIKELKLDELHRRIINRMNDVKINLKYHIFIKPLPKLGVILLHIKDSIRAFFS